MRRNVLLLFVFRNGVASGRIAAVDAEDRIHLIVSDGLLIDLVPEKFRVEIVRGVLVRRGQFDPGKRAWSMMINVRHDGIIARRMVRSSAYNRRIIKTPKEKAP